MKSNIYDLNLLQIFCKVVELGSFSKAALDLSWPKSRVSRSINKIEELLETQLIRRTTRSFSLTEQGKQFYLQVNPILNGLNEEIDKLYTQCNKLSGPIRITAPADICVFLLADIIQDFSNIYPKINITLEISRDIKDLVLENFDIAFRLGPVKNLSYKITLLTELKLIFVGSQSYFKKYSTPIEKEDILKHRLLLLQTENGPLPLEAINLKPKKIFTCSNYPLLYRMTKNDFGIGIIPDFICKSDLKEGIVKQLFPKWEIFKIGLNLLYPPSKNLPKRVRLFIDFSKEEIRKKISH